MKTGYKKICVLTLLCAVSGIGLYRFSTHVFGIEGYQFSLDSKLSPAMHKAIKEAVYESYVISLSALTESLTQKCPALETISI